MKTPPTVHERRKPAPAEYAGLEVRIDAIEERDNFVLVTVSCPQLSRQDQLSFSWGPRRGRSKPTLREIEQAVQEDYLPSLTEPWQRHQELAKTLGKVIRGNTPL